MTVFQKGQGTLAVLATVAVQTFSFAPNAAADTVRSVPVATVDVHSEFPVALSSPYEGARELSAYVVGDHLKIAFFERIDAADTSSAPAPSDLVERAELSGEYIVQEDGNLFLPLIGSVLAAGQSPQGFQDKLAERFKSALNRNAKVSIILTEREPIYVVGSITRPGTYKYTPGMTVMHAIALAEGLDGAGADFSRAAESIRERERLDRAVKHLHALLARQAVLVAERDGRPPVAPRLVTLAGQSMAQELMAKVAAERKLAIAARETQSSALDATITAAQSELEILRVRLTHVEASIKNRTERLDTLDSMRSRGTSSDFGLYQARGELADVLDRADTAKSSIAQIEQKLSQARHDKMKLEFEAQIELHLALNAIDNDIAEEDLTLIASERLIRAAGNALHTRMLTPQNAGLAIVRRTPSGQRRIMADGMTVLQAGDLLEIVSTPLSSLGAAPMKKAEDAVKAPIAR